MANFTNWMTSTSNSCFQEEATNANRRMQYQAMTQTFREWSRRSAKRTVVSGSIPQGGALGFALFVEDPVKEITGLTSQS